VTADLLAAPQLSTAVEWASDVLPTWTTPGAWRRFIAKVVVTPGCRYWVGAIADDGYGRFTDHEGRCVRVSRYLLCACTRPLPHQLVAEHRVCDEPTCTRLSHLKASTQAENLDAAPRHDRAGDGHCPGRADNCGTAACLQAIRNAQRDPARGFAYDPDRLTALAASDAHADQGQLFAESSS